MLERVDAALAVFSEEVRRGPAGSAPPGIAPSNAYLRKDGSYAFIVGNRADPRRLAAASTFTHGNR